MAPPGAGPFRGGDSVPRNTRLGRLAAASLVALATVTARPAAAAQPDFGQLRPLAAAATVAGRAGGPVRPPSAPIDGDAVARALGKSGQVMPGGVYRVAMPRGDLS